ncbi:22788_t:CDS:2, partial [Gigaspora rosea]
SRSEALCFIKKQYTKIYKKEEIDLEAANSITRNLPMVSKSVNLALMQAIKQDEVVTIIRSLPNNKSPGLDGLTYEFYKLLEDAVAPVLTTKNLVGNLFSNQEAHIFESGCLSEPFRVKRGLTIGIGSYSDWLETQKLFNTYKAAAGEQESLMVLGYSIFQNSSPKKDLWTLTIS